MSISEHFQPPFQQIELQVPAKISAEIRNRHILAEVFVYPKQKAPAFDDPVKCIVTSKNLISEILRSVVSFNLFANGIFYNVYTGNAIDKNGEHYLLSQLTPQQELTFCKKPTFL